MDLVKIALAGLGIIAAVTFFALLGGTLVWLMWPVFGKAFPAVVSSGFIAQSLSWWDSVCVTWIFSLLIKSSQTNNNGS